MQLRTPNKSGGDCPPFAQSAEQKGDCPLLPAGFVRRSYRIHAGLGPGLLESVYEAVLARELERRGLHVERQWPVSFEFDGMIFEEGFRIDLFVEGVVAVELKSVERIAPIHGKQLLTYLRLMKSSVGLLINFGQATLKEGLKRIVNNYSPSSTSSRLRVNERRFSRGDAETRKEEEEGK